MQPDQFSVKFVPSGRGKARCEPNPKYPNGVHIELSKAGVPSCATDLPYPAPECGMWDVACQTCGNHMLITAAGRPDDPRSVRFPCLTKAQEN